MKSTFVKISAAAFSLFPVVALAHPGHDSMAFTSGLTHPITGIDHLIMLVAFGLLVGCLTITKKQKLGLLASALITLMVGLLAGSVFGLASGVELAIVASLFVVSLAIWQVFGASQRMVKLAVGFCIGMMFFHGYAHGVEAQGTLGQFSLGMAIGASALMVIGTQLGQALASRWMSVGVAAASSLFLMAA
ncbi:HupE/UreJ family protein [Vibrio methylphosphonaticus]|uniref:HupE/UreJ family protein n=1 Tax=Vibrio methylphosphonaticus TaxID=2946866 RepID=UPI002029DB1B|nr:HupE/UreJ family protein [Vibrio methylphosphonaticus]MCL9776840.1 HupE/UreJ family protein [Vibrio methylphosphonaticus]